MAGTTIHLVVVVPERHWAPAWWIAERLRALAGALGCSTERLHVGNPADKEQIDA